MKNSRYGHIVRRNLLGSYRLNSWVVTQIMNGPFRLTRIACFYSETRVSAGRVLMIHPNTNRLTPLAWECQSLD